MGGTFLFLRANRRRIAISLLLAYAAFVLIHPDEDGRIFDLIFFAMLAMLIASQLFWIRRVVDVGERFLPGKPRRALLGAIAGAICLMLFVYNLATWNSDMQINTNAAAAAAHRIFRRLVMRSSGPKFAKTIMERKRPENLRQYSTKNKRSVPYRDSQLS